MHIVTDPDNIPTILILLAMLTGDRFCRHWTLLPGFLLLVGDGIERKGGRKKGC